MSDKIYIDFYWGKRSNAGQLTTIPVSSASLSLAHLKGRLDGYKQYIAKHGQLLKDEEIDDVLISDFSFPNSPPKAYDLIEFCSVADDAEIYMCHFPVRRVLDKSNRPEKKDNDHSIDASGLCLLRSDILTGRAFVQTLIETVENER